jgi:metal-responsive CopG/Arc/MetJ family transcriptional regulator
MVMTRKQVLVQLDSRLVDRLDQVAASLEISRSELLRRSAETYLRRIAELASEQEYTEAYRHLPETAEELAMAESAARAMIEAEPW